MWPSTPAMARVFLFNKILRRSLPALMLEVCNTCVLGATNNLLCLFDATPVPKSGFDDLRLQLVVALCSVSSNTQVATIADGRLLELEGVVARNTARLFSTWTRRCSATRRWRRASSVFSERRPAPVASATGSSAGCTPRWTCLPVTLARHSVSRALRLQATLAPARTLLSRHVLRACMAEASLSQFSKVKRAAALLLLCRFGTRRLTCRSRPHRRLPQRTWRACTSASFTTRRNLAGTRVSRH